MDPSMIRLCHMIHDKRTTSNTNTLEEILQCKDRITLDGCYRSVYTHREQLKNLKVPKPILFVMGFWAGKDNSWDTGQPVEQFCTWNEIFDLQMNYGFELGFHTWLHQDLTALSDVEVIKEITPPFPMKYFAYPGGSCNERTARLVEQAGYEEAFSVTQGNDSRYQRKRGYLNW